MNAHARWRLVAGYAAGVWCGLTAWAALAQYVLPGRGHALGKLGSFHWVFVINLLPALLCAAGFAVGLAVVRRTAAAGGSSWSVALLLGLLFPLTVLPMKPVFAQLGDGLGPALAWCVIGSAVVGGLLRGWGRRGMGHGDWLRAQSSRCTSAESGAIWSNGCGCLLRRSTPSRRVAWRVISSGNTLISSRGVS